MTFKDTETLVRFVRLRDELKPLPIYLDGPISPDWVVIVQSRSKHERRTDITEEFVVYFMMDDGTDLEFEQYETLQIAMDQAKDNYGIEKSEWSKCNKEITWDTPLTWKSITQQTPPPYGSPATGSPSGDA